MTQELKEGDLIKRLRKEGKKLMSGSLVGYGIHSLNKLKIHKHVNQRNSRKSEEIKRREQKKS